MKTKLLSLTLAMLMLLGMAAACSNSGTGDATDPPTQGGTTAPTTASSGETTTEPTTTGGRKTLTFADSEWEGTNLFRCAGWYHTQNFIADSYFTKDPEDNSKILPGICERLDIDEDAKTMTMVFPEGLKFADGQDVTPEDVIASIRYGQEVSDYGFGYENITDMEIHENGRDVILHYDVFRTDCVFFLSDAFLGLMKASDIESKPDEMWDVMPYGMFYVDEYVPASHVILKPNPYYKTLNPLVENKGPSKLEYITVKMADVETFTLNTALMEGELDMLTGINMEQYAELKDAQGITVLDNTYPNIEYFELNTDSPHFGDINVRKAIMLAIDRDEMEVMCNGSFKPEYSMITSGVQNYSQEAADWFEANLANDVEQAKQLLADAGYTMGSDGYLEKDGSTLEFTFMARTSGTSVTVAQELQLQMKEIGVLVNIETIDWNYIYERISADDYDAGIQVLGWAEPILVLDAAYYDENHMPQDWQDAYYAKVKECAEEADPATAVQLIYETQMMMFENCDIVPLYSDVEYCAFRSDIEGLLVTSSGSIYYNDVG